MFYCKRFDYYSEAICGVVVSGWKCFHEKGENIEVNMLEKKRCDVWGIGRCG